MKKRILVIAAIVLALLAFCAATAAADSLPAKIQEYMDGTGAKVTGSAAATDNTTWFVLAKDGKGTNVLFCFAWKNNEWKYQFKTSKAVWQGKGEVYIVTDSQIQDIQTDRVYKGSILVIGQNSEDGEYAESFCAFMRSKSGVWNLFRMRSINGKGYSMLFEDGSISYFKDVEGSRISGSVQGTYQRDLRYLNISSIPKTLKSAQSKLTVAPTLPKGSDLQAQEVQFKGGKKYEVYSAPSKNSIRGANGKASVSTNGWIQVFGRENGWILIQYSIDSDHYRFGYIEDSSLPKDAAVSWLDFNYITVEAERTVSVTDDPLYSHNTLTTLQAGETVTWLASVGDWAYIEGSNYRGFVPSDAVSIPQSKETFTEYTAANGQVYDLFEITKLLYDAGHKVYAVEGNYSRVIEDEDCYASEEADGGKKFTYMLAQNFHARMLNRYTSDPADTFTEETDLYDWYVAAYLGDVPVTGNLVFQCDLSEEEQLDTEVDFWFVTTKIRLNDQGEIEYMEYVYVPWG